MDPQGLLYVCVCTGALLLLLQSVSLYSILSLSPFLKYIKEVQQRGEGKKGSSTITPGAVRLIMNESEGKKKAAVNIGGITFTLASSDDNQNNKAPFVFQKNR